MVGVLEERLAEACPDIRVQYIRSLSVGPGKSVEDEDVGAVVNVRVSPRGYDGPMVPTCTIPCVVSLAVRSDVDPYGACYVSMMDAVLSVLARWQACMDDVHEAFDIPGAFTLAGFRLSSGTTRTDAGKRIWTYAHGFELIGVVEN